MQKSKIKQNKIVDISPFLHLFCINIGKIFYNIVWFCQLFTMCVFCDNNLKNGVISLNINNYVIVFAKIFFVTNVKYLKVVNDVQNVTNNLVL